MRISAVISKMSAPTVSTSFDFRALVKGWLMCRVLCPNIIQITVCFFVMIAFHTSSSMLHYAWICRCITHCIKYVTMNRMCKLMHFHTSQWMSTQYVFWFSWSGKGEVDVNRNSDYNVIFCRDYNVIFCRDPLLKLKTKAQTIYRKPHRNFTKLKSKFYLFLG